MKSIVLIWFTNCCLKNMGFGLLAAFTLLFNIVPMKAGGTSRLIGQRMPLLMPDDFESMKLVSWRVEEGEPDDHNPLLEPKMPWDSGGIMAHGTVLKDPIDGLWKAWQVSTPGEPTMEGLESQHEFHRRLTYLESKDGVNWYRPDLDIVKWLGYEHNNIIFDMDSGGTSVYASVFVHPENKEWPYEMFVMRSPKWAGLKENTVGGRPGPHERFGNYRYHSKDGKNWELFEGPIYPSHGGGGDVSYVYNMPDGSYVSYFKTYTPLRPEDRIIPYDNNSRGALRSVSRRTSPDGSDWGNEDLVLLRDWRDPNYAQFLEICPVPVEGGFVALVNYYDASLQTMCLQLAASRDGVHWWRPDRRPALPNPPLGDYGGGMIWQMHHPIVDGDRMYVYYAGSEGLHGEIYDTRFEPRLEVGNETVIGMHTPTLPFNTALCRASWRFDRLWALVSSAGGVTLGEAITKPGDPNGAQLVLNVRVKSGGALRAELLDMDGLPVPGFTMEDCEPVTGDHNRVIVGWEGGDQAPANAVKIRFQLHRALLYGYGWEHTSQ